MSDDGLGIEPDKAKSGLGTQIVSTVVAGELAGTITWDRRKYGPGTIVRVNANLDN